MVSCKAPRISFVVPCYNYGRYLPECLTSIFSQEGRHDFEVIAVDDGSTDHTPAVLNAFADPRLRVITHPVNRGHVAAVHTGLSQARGAFIARIDPDDRYRPYFLSVALEKFDAFPAVGLIYGDAALIDERGQITAERVDRVHGRRDFKGNEFLRLLEENFICAPTVIARREAWLRALPVPEGLAFHDWYFTLMIARTYEFYYVDRVLADYRVHSLNHHRRIVQDRSEEASVFQFLDRIFCESESDFELEKQKQQSKRRVYGAQYRTLADKYFGLEMHGDARRCYWQALRHTPRYLRRADILRHLAATLVGRKGYRAAKSLYGRYAKIWSGEISPESGVRSPESEDGL